MKRVYVCENHDYWYYTRESEQQICKVGGRILMQTRWQEKMSRNSSVRNSQTTYQRNALFSMQNKLQKTKTELLKIFKLGTVGPQQKIQHICIFELLGSGVLQALNLYKLLMKIFHRCVLSWNPLTTLNAGVPLFLWKAVNSRGRENKNTAGTQNSC